MRAFSVPLVFLLSLLFVVGSIDAAERETVIPLYVSPYYSAAQPGQAQPQVDVARAFDALLADGRAEQLDTVAAAIRANSGTVTPMTMMVLAIRYYDAGRRDDAVFWFYVAKDRYRSAARVIDFKDPRLSEIRSAMLSFAELAGPYINGYAFCDIDNQKAIRARAADWAVANPYAVVLSPSLPALPGDRTRNLEDANAQLIRDARDEADALRNPETRKAISEGRRQNDADARFCVP